MDLQASTCHWCGWGGVCVRVWVVWMALGVGYISTLCPLVSPPRCPGWIMKIRKVFKVSVILLKCPRTLATDLGFYIFALKGNQLVREFSFPMSLHSPQPGQKLMSALHLDLCLCSYAKVKICIMHIFFSHNAAMRYTLCLKLHTIKLQFHKIAFSL